MNTNCFRHISEFENARDEWDKMHSVNFPQNPLSSFEYIKMWYESFTEPENVRVYRASDHGETIGFLPLVMKKNNGLKVLSNLVNDHCMQYEFLFRKDSTKLFISKILQEISSDKDWDRLDYKFSYSFDDAYPFLSESIAEDMGLRIYIKEENTYSIFIKKTCAEYIQNDLSANTRKSIRSARNKIARAGEFKYRHYCGLDAVKKWPDLLKIEDSGWKGRGGTSILKLSPRTRKFYEDLIAILARTDDLHLYFLELNNKEIAAAFGHIAGDTFQCVKGAYDEDYSNLAPFNSLFMHLMEDLCMNQNVKRFHIFPYDDSGYKQKFANERATYTDVSLYNNTASGRAIYFIDNVKRKISEKPLLARNLKKVLNMVKS